MKSVRRATRDTTKTTRAGKASKTASVSWRDKAQSFDLEEWYSSEDAKRHLGSICRALNVQKQTVQLLGPEEKPFATLAPAGSVRATQFDITILIDDAKANWSSITAAVLFFGSVFRISGTHHVHAVLQRHQFNRHPALQYRRPQLEDIPQNVSILLDDLREISDRFSNTTALIDRRFKEVWRGQNVTEGS
jgi:hypothetical protein